MTGGRKNKRSGTAMTDAPKLHLVKLSVGTESVEGLIEWQTERALERAASGRDPRPMHITRMRPKRSDELLSGGSIFWVIKRNIVARQRLTGMETVTGQDGIERCALILDPSLVRVEPRPKRPFQGWRYLSLADAPPDLTDETEVLADMPSDLREALSSFGVR